MAVPPFIVCTGIKSINAKALHGIYEYKGALEGRCVYRQSGISSHHYLWFDEEPSDSDTPYWVVTPQDSPAGKPPEVVVARSAHLARWPWEVEAWTVSGRDNSFLEQPMMRFSLPSPAAELLVTLPAAPPGQQWSSAEGNITARYHAAGFLNNRPAYQGVDAAAPAGTPEGLGAGSQNLRLFWMPKSGRWMIGAAQDGFGVQSLMARSVPDDGSSWASVWPWEASQNWEVPTATTYGLQDGDATWHLHESVKVELSSPGVFIHCEDDPAQGGLGGLQGFYESKGMTNGRVFYMQRLQDSELSGFTGPKCLWYAEERGQWVVTPPNMLGNSNLVLARISSRAWWPWEAHVGGTTSPQSMGAMTVTNIPPWHSGTALISKARADWEVADQNGTLQQAPNTYVELDPDAACAAIKAAGGSKQPFIGVYLRAGILSARPFFLQSAEEVKKKKTANSKKGAARSPVRRGEKAANQRREAASQSPARQRAFHPPATPRYAIWYAEDKAQWVISEDFRLLDSLTVDARASSSAWFPWQVAFEWEVSDGVGGFIRDPQLRVEEVA